MLDRRQTERLTVAELAGRQDFPLGSAQISPSTRVVRGPGGVAALEPRTMQVLLALSDADGAVVTRQDIFQRCWGDAVVGDDSLNRAVADIRRVARNVAAGSFTIETVPRTGYRLVSSAPQTAAVQGRVAGARSRRLVLGGAGAVLAAGGLSWLAIDRRGADAARQDLIARSEEAARMRTPEASARAVHLLEQAVALAPRDATAWGRLALANVTLVDASPPGQAPAALAAVQNAARRALALDPRQIDALSALAIVPPYFGDWLAAEQRMREVLKVAPDHLPTLDELAFLLVAVGRVGESVRMRLAFSPREPLHVGVQYRLIYAYWILGRVEEADRAADRAMQLWPKHPAVWFARLWTLAFTGRPERALAHVRDAAGRPPLPDWMLQTLELATAAIGSGRRAEVDAAVSRLLGEVVRGPSNSINALLLLSGLGAVDRAYDVAQAYLLEEGPLMASVRWRPGQMVVDDQRRRKTHMLFVPVTGVLRSDPRFGDLVRRIGLADYWRAVGKTPDFQRTA